MHSETQPPPSSFSNPTVPQHLLGCCHLLPPFRPLPPFSSSAVVLSGTPQRPACSGTSSHVKPHVRLVLMGGKLFLGSCRVFRTRYECTGALWQGLCAHVAAVTRLLARFGQVGRVFGLFRFFVVHGGASGCGLVLRLAGLCCCECLCFKGGAGLFAAFLCNTPRRNGRSWSDLEAVVVSHGSRCQAR